MRWVTCTVHTYTTCQRVRYLGGGVGDGVTVYVDHVGVGVISETVDNTSEVCSTCKYRQNYLYLHACVLGLNSMREKCLLKDDIMGIPLLESR